MRRMFEPLAPLFTVDRGGLLLMFVRLLLALALGLAIAAVYRRSRPMNDEAESFTVTLVLLTILIAMVTQVIGDNVARAFSLVGALSIVRFRTVVRDTQDTAYVIFAVALGMAIGSNHPAMALCGLMVVGFAAYVLRPRNAVGLAGRGEYPFALNVRLTLGKDAEALLGSTLDQYLAARQLMSAATARQGMSIDIVYAAALRAEQSAGELVNALNRIEGVQTVTLQRNAAEDG
jgi:hypothetical protein